MRRSAGFTLLEVLLATALLAMALTLAFATLRAAGATAQRGEALAERNERSRAVSDFLRRRIGGAQQRQDVAASSPRRVHGCCGGRLATSGASAATGPSLAAPPGEPNGSSRPGSVSEKNASLSSL